MLLTKNTSSNQRIFSITTISALFLVVVNFVSLSVFAGGLSNVRAALMPMPQNTVVADEYFVIKPSMKIFIDGMSDKRKSHILMRLKRHLKNSKPLNFKRLTLVKESNNAELVVNINNKTATLEAPVLNNDESYQLVVEKENVIITANTEFGALHAISTLTQLFTTHINGSLKVQKIQAMTINDEPRFPWRGLLIDSVRHFLPVSTIKRQLDGMAAAKLNVFHWHLTDDQGWRIESKSYPKLHLLASDGLYYSQQEIKDVVSYASLLGIRVVPEFDIPGHASAIAVAYPELMAVNKHYDMERHWGVFEPLLDVSNEKTYQFIDAIVAELVTLFPDEYIHIGGDEVNPKQWQGHAGTRQLMVKERLKDYEDLHRFFNTKVQKLLQRYDRKMMGWDEIFHKDLPKNIVVQSWRGLESLNKIAVNGFKGLLSTGYYIDQPQLTSYHYRNDPVAALEEDSHEDQHIDLTNMDNIASWQFSITRLKGSAVKGSLTIQKPNNEASVGYVKLNNNFHKKVSITYPNEQSEQDILFSFDTWMGPTRFSLNLANNQLSGSVFVGNSYYSIAGEKLIKPEKNITTLKPLTKKHAQNILGGEATLWSEMVDEKNIDLRVWPRLFAIAERLWSKATLQDSEDMYSRLASIDQYADEIIGLQHKKQFEQGLSSLLSDSAKLIANEEEALAALVLFSQAIEPAHYYTRHHLKYQQNAYHQYSALNNLVDYLPVESTVVYQMNKDVQAYIKGDLTRLTPLKVTLKSWLNNTELVGQLFNRSAKLFVLNDLLLDVKKTTEIALDTINFCGQKNKDEQQLQSINSQLLLTIQKKQREEVVAVIPAIKALMSHCMAA